MRYLNKIASFFGMASLGLMAMTSCEGGDLFSVDSPDWLSQKVDSIAATKGGGEDEIPGLMEDVYTVGNTDFSSGWWADFSRYYVIPEGEKWVAQFNLNINPDATYTYKNFALIVTNDASRGDADYKEYGAIRYDNQPSGNSEWGDLYFNSRRSNVESTLTFQTDTDEGVQKLGGKVTLTVDRSVPGAFSITMTNGTVTKTYKQNESLPSLNDDASNMNIRCFLVPEGSYINFLGTTIEPIGGCTSAADKAPLSMSLNSVPKKVLVGTTLEEALANMSATVYFEQDVKKTIPFADLLVTSLNDFSTTGTKDVCFIYNKTFKGENCSPIVAHAQVEVVDKMYNVVGATDNSTGYQGASSDIIKVAPNETDVSQFTNYTNGAANWNNFLVVLTNSANVQYCVARADNWILDRDNDTEVSKYSDAAADWASWLAAMDGAKVTLYVTNNGDNTATVKAVMVGNNGVTYVQEFNNIQNINSDDLYFRLSVEKAHLEFDEVLGNEDNTSGYNSVRSPEINVPAGQKFTTTFINNTLGGANWNNYNIVLKGASQEYSILRADNWANFGNHDERNCDIGAGWDTWRAAMCGARVTVTVTNLGNDKADVDIKILGNEGSIFTQYYHGVAVNSDDLNFCLTVDGCHLIFDSMSAVQ